jgi:hypothetical protein
MANGVSRRRGPPKSTAAHSANFFKLKKIFSQKVCYVKQAANQAAWQQGDHMSL